ncbi:MAG: alpha-L-fucosidase [Victivallales bacterium]|nr:alpha-L-fucosidase [Victivallales bacterium]
MALKCFNDRRDWFFKAKYGMFVHFGIYTIFEKQEQVLWRWGMDYDEYDQAIPLFNPKKYSPKEWLDLAEKCGMRYVVITAKHHDGFCMWDTKYTDYNVMHTPYGKDIVKMLADECHRRNFPLVIYYSVVDWHRPDYPNLGRSHEIKTDPKFHNVKTYLKYVENQIAELCTSYGRIDGFWWDMNVAYSTRVRRINNLIRKLQPTAVINNRGFDEGDFSTPERTFSKNERRFFTSPTEACEAIGRGSWAYRKEEDYISLFALEAHIASYMAMGANFLLGVAPRKDGCLSPQSQDYMKKVGLWYGKVEKALKATPVVVKDVPYVTTGDQHTIYLFILDPLRYATLQLPQMDIREARLLNDGRKLPLTSQPLVYVKGIADRPVSRIREIPINEYPNEVLVLQLKGNFNIKESLTKLTKSQSWFFHQSSKTKE